MDLVPNYTMSEADYLYNHISSIDPLHKQIRIYHFIYTAIWYSYYPGVRNHGKLVEAYLTAIRWMEQMDPWCKAAMKRLKEYISIVCDYENLSQPPNFDDMLLPDDAAKFVTREAKPNGSG